MIFTYTYATMDIIIQSNLYYTTFKWVCQVSRGMFRYISPLARMASAKSVLFFA